MWIPEQKTADLIYDFADRTFRQVVGGTVILEGVSLTEGATFFDAGTVYAVVNAHLAP